MSSGRHKDAAASAEASEEPMDTSAPANQPAPNQDNPENAMDTSAASTTIRGVPEYAPIEVPPAPQTVATYDINGPRLMITKIVNENFKSYAGVQTLGPFHKSFSSIIGPNGSGKSNVIDSMLFVFGYRANKIRSKKISVLLHNSEQHRDITCCTVAVHFQKIIDTGIEDDDYDVVPNSQFVVSRTAFKDNSSYYKINDKKATYKEVATLLRGSGIDLDHNRFLILQGEVEQIALMKPKALTEHDEGMLEFLEDIIGSSRFKEPIEKLTGRVEELNELRTEKLNRVKAVEKEKDDLEGVKNEAVQFLSMENEVTRKKNMLYQKYIHECAGSLSQATEQRDKIHEGMKEMTEKLAQITDSKKSLSKEYKKAYKKYEELSKSCDERKEDFSKFEQQDVRCREDLKHAKSKSKKLDKALEAEKKKLEELLLIPEKMEKDKEELQGKLQKLENDKEKEEEKLKQVMESLKTETQGLTAEKDKKETELLELQKAVNETRSQLNVKQSELDLYQRNQQSEEKKLKETERNLDKAAKALEDRQKAMQDLRTQIPETETALIRAEKDLQEADAQTSEVVQQVRSTRNKVEEARSALQSARSQGKVLQALMEQKRSGKIPGIYGRLGDLGAIDMKYDIAVSTACGPLDNIVVDTIDTAQKCVDFLKRSNAGRATFTALDKMQHFKNRYSRPIQTPENVPRLFDLINVKDESVRPAFYHGLQDTIVAKDLEQGTRIAYGKQRFRVVTLGGQLIDISGTMSGGGGRVSKGRMGSTVVEEFDPKKLEQLESKLAKDSQQERTLHENKVRLEETVEKLRRKLHDLKHSNQKFTVDIKSLTEQVSTLEKQKVDQAERVKAAAPDEKTLKELEKQVERHRAEFKKANDAASGVEDKVHELHKQIMEIGGTKLKAAESRVNLVSSQIDQIMGHITKANVAKKNASRNAKKSEDKVQSIEDEIKETRESVEKLEVEFKQLEEDATKVLEEYQKAQEDMKAMEDSLSEIKEAMSKLEEGEEKLNKDNMEVKHELEKYDTIISDNTKKTKYWSKERGKLQLHVIDGQENDSAILEEIAGEVLNDVCKDDLTLEITAVEEKLLQMKPNMAAIAEYKKKEEQYLKRVSELDQITDLRDSQRRLHEDLRKQRLDEFMTGFGVITNKLKEMYQMITLGGDAELELVDSLDPFSEGIVFSVRPPKKSWKNISNLSGGEKTLSSLALVFALHHYKPTPLYVMDEIDAALDFKNVSIVANYIKERTKNAQFIIISLRNNMFELADRLIGIYKTYNCTKSVTINPKKISLPVLEDETTTNAA